MTPKISIIVPIFDLRKCQFRALETALQHQGSRDHYEVVAVLGRLESYPGGIPKSGHALLDQCDQVIPTDLDSNDQTSEIGYYLAGIRHSRGDYLFLAEGHTEIARGAIQGILTGIQQNPNCEVFWGERTNVANSSLGRLISMNNARHVERAKREGYFTLGGASVVKKTLFEQLGEFIPRYSRFNEVILRYRLLNSGLPVTKLNVLITHHYNDMPIRHLVDICMAMGRGKQAAYRDAAENRVQGIPPVRHWVYRWLRGSRIARLGDPLLRRTSYLFLALAVLGQRIHSKLGFRFYYLGLGCADVAGFCRSKKTPLPE